MKWPIVAWSILVLAPISSAAAQDAPVPACVCVSCYKLHVFNDTAHVLKDRQKYIGLRGYDEDSDDQDDLTYAMTSGPSHGTLLGSAPNLCYIPSAGYTGTDQISFQVYRNTGASTCCCADGTISITVSDC